MKLATPMEFTAHNINDTDRIGAALAQSVPDGTTIALSGTLGAGKTRLVQAIAAACGINPQDVVSPTFVLCQEYRGKRRLVHLDAYRIADDDEFLQLGVDEYFDSEAIVLIEWAERVADCLPRDYLVIEIEVTGDTKRTFRCRAQGSKLEPVVDKIKESLTV